MFGWITEEYSISLHHASLILNCKTLVNQIFQVKMSYYFCEANKCVNALAKKGLTQDYNQWRS